MFVQYERKLSMKKSKSTAAERAAAKARKALAGAANGEMSQAATEVQTQRSYGETIAEGLKAQAAQIREQGGMDAGAIATVLDILAEDEILSIAEPDGGTFDYLIEAVKERAPFHLRTAINSEIRKVRDGAKAQAITHDGIEARL